MSAIKTDDYVSYFIYSPDGITTHPEPFRCLKKDFFDDMLKNFESWKENFKSQGYYSSNDAGIDLEDLLYRCSIIFEEEEEEE